MRLRYSFWSMAASLVLVILSTQAQLFAQYTINTLASSTGSLLIHGQGVAVDSANNVYVDGTFNGYTWPAVVKATASGLSVMAGTSSLYGSTACAQPSTNELLSDIGGVWVDGSGNVYITASGGDQVLRVNGTILCLVNGQLNANGFNGVVTDSAGNLYFASYENHTIYKLAAGATQPSAFAGNGMDGCGNGEMSYPEGIALDGAGNMYIADQYCNAIWKLNLRSPNTIGIAAGTPPPTPGAKGGFSGDKGLATSAMLSTPYGVAVDLFGNLYIADTGNNRIRKVGSDGNIDTIAGSGIAGFSGDGGAATPYAELSNPKGIAVGLDGKVYVGDSGNQRIRVLTPAWAGIDSPVPGTVLFPTVTFTWSGGAPGSTYELDISDKIGAIGQGDLYWNPAIVGQESETVSLPCDGRKIYVQLGTSVNGVKVNPGTYAYQACQPVYMSVTPTTLPKTGGTVYIFMEKLNYFPGSTLTLTKAPYPEICFIRCSPTVLASWTTPATGEQLFWAFYSYNLNVPALPPAYPYAEQFTLTATVYSGGVAKDSVSVIVTQY